MPNAADRFPTQLEEGCPPARAVPAGGDEPCPAPWALGEPPAVSLARDPGR